MNAVTETKPVETKPDEAKSAEAGSAPALAGVVAYLSLDGAIKAAEFYKQAFGATEVGAIPPDGQGRTMHVYLLVNGGALMLSDFYPEHGYPKVDPQGYMLHLQVDDIESWWKRAVDAGARVKVDLHDAFWGDLYGQLTDPWGVVWTLGMTPKR
jgi:PhnB protein